MRTWHSVGPSARTRALLTIGLVVGACSGTASISSEQAEPSAIPSPTAAPTAVPAPAPTPTAPPTPTPVPTPTPDPLPTLSVHGVAGSALQELRLDTASPWRTIGVTIDGRLRAVTKRAGGGRRTVATVWFPEGPHRVCVGPVPADAKPMLWSAAEPAAETASASAALIEQSCTDVMGRVDVPTTLFPGHRVVAYYGSGVTSALGVLGEGGPDAATERLLGATAAFDEFELPTVPAFEYIVTVAQARPGDDGLYTYAWPSEGVLPYLERMRAEGGIVVLDFQPGQEPFLDQVKAYEDLLVEPDVHIALDPEWSMRPGMVPGRVIGSTDAATVNEVLAYMSELVARHGLPQKLVIIHQFQLSMIENRDDIVAPPGIAVMFHVDGQGPVGTKYDTYGALFVEPPFFNGFKVFFDEDSRVMTPAEVVALEPPPVYVSYQ